MCGIAGIVEIFRKAGSSIDAKIAKNMVDSLAHRGPDDSDLHTEDRVALGHRRLSIIDVAGGHQPIFNEDKSICVVFNGEIYNYQTVTEELKLLGHHFQTQSDTEIIVHGWEQWGVNCLDKFRGMFSFVLWDNRKKQVFIVRDRLGVKPLYYAMLPNGQLLFGSELKAIVSHPRFQKTIDPTAVADYLALGYVPDPKTIYSTAKKLPSAHYLLWTVETKQPDPQRYWKLSYEKIKSIDAIEAERELRRLIDESVKLRMIADVPLGAFLSGGVDSSVVVAAMSRINPSLPVTTCSIGFDVPEYDESRFAQIVANHCKTNHVTRIVTANDLEIVEKLPAIFDEPFSDSSALPSYRVSQIARERVTVSLSGDGGDESFGGYRRYRLHIGENNARKAIPNWLRSGVVKPMSRLYPEWGWLPRSLRAKTTLQSIANTPLQAYFRTMSAIPDSIRTNVVSKDFSKQLGGYHPSAVFEQAAESFAGSVDSFDYIQHIDLQTWLPGDINVKADRTSMAHSLEVREPLLDHVLMEWAASLPQRLKVSPSGAKIILKDHARKVLPEGIVDRPKQGFSVPMQEWFKGPLAAQLRNLQRSTSMNDYLDQQQVERLLDQHISGARNYDRALWTIFSLGNFMAHIQ